MEKSIFMDKLKKEFINTIALRSAINAAVQTRSNKYPVFSQEVTISEQDSRETQKKKIERKRNLLVFWRNTLVEMASEFKTAKTTSDFSNNVEQLRTKLNMEDCNAFANGTARIGQCQKSLSVYIKWLWCLNEIEPEPPVCPVDRNVINKCYTVLDRKTENDDRQFLKSVNSNGGWGNINDIETYKKIIRIIDKVAKKEEKSMAKWELSFFNDFLEQEDE